jgi:uncharacterized Zn finger protein
MEDKLHFICASSSGEGNYNIVAYQTENGVRLSCDCQAGVNGMMCKHRLAVMTGSTNKFSRCRPEDIASLKLMLDGHPCWSIMDAIKGLEAEAERVKKAIAAEKKGLARSLMGGGAKA